MVNPPDTAVYIVITALIVFRLPAFGHRVLAFLRDFDQYRRERASR